MYAYTIKMLLRTGLRQRWARRSVLVVGAALAVVVISFGIFFYSYFYATVRTGLESKAKSATDFFSSYVSKSTYYDTAYRYTETFVDRDKIEMQFLSPDGRLQISSLGVTAGTSAANMPDVHDAVATGKICVWVGRRSLTGERVMSVSAPLIYADGQVIGVMRFITALKQADTQIAMSALVVFGIGVVVLLIVVSINVFFIRAVIAPVGEITKMSKRIAEGSYGILLANNYRDEMGEMVDSINEMSLKIAQSEKVKTEFISLISHELRTPLTAITGWGETLIYGEGLDDDTRRGITIILREARRLTKMVEELLEFTRIEDGRFTLNIEMIDLAAELEDAIFTYRELLRQDELELRYTPIDAELPLIPGDANRIKQVILNLLDNAAKYARDGKRIDISMEERGDYLAIIIRDYGSGVPEDELEHLKKKFYKGSNSRERGSGIGLAVCDEIVRFHGGALELENAEGGGLRITIVLPMTNAATLSSAM